MTFAKSSSISSVQRIDKTFVKSYIQLLSSLRPRTIRRKIASSKAFLNFLEYEDLIPVNPYRKIKLRIKKPADLPVVMNLVEIHRLFASIKTKMEEVGVCSRKASASYQERTIRDLCIMEFLFSTGARVSELCDLKNADFDLDTGEVLIKGKGGKERIARICNNETLSIMRAYFHKKTQKGSGDAFFQSRLGRRISEQTVRLLVTKYCKSAKIKKRITPHTFRHTFATLLLEQGVDLIFIQGFLGHSSISTTQIYTHINRKKQMEVLSKSHPRHQFALETS